MLKGKIKNGFSFKANEKVLNDWRFVKLIAKTESGNMTEKFIAVTKIVEMLLGDEEEERLTEYIASKNDGFVPQDEMYHAVIDIINVMKEKIEKSKKSSPSPE